MKLPKLESKDWLILLLGVIATVIVSNINTIFQIFLNFVSALSIGFSNYYYEQIGNDNSNSVLFVAGCFILFSVIFSYLHLEITLIKDTKRYRLKNEIEEKELADISKEDNEIITNIKERTVKRKNSKRFFNIYARTVLVRTFTLLVMCIYIILNILFYSNVSSKNHDFKNKTTVIAPYIENEKILQLNSEWKRMKSKTDYIKIETEIKNIYKSNNIEYE